MKLSKDDFERSGQADPLALFEQGIRADETREKYTRTLRQVLCGMLEDILEGTFEERVAQMMQMGREDPGWVRDLMLSLSRKLRERTLLPTDHPQYLNPATFSNYFKPIKKLLDMNDVAMPWKRIYVTFPEEENPSTSRGWERAEIAKMLRFCRGPLDRSFILVCASSGIRVGGFAGLEWRDLAPVYRTPDGSLWMDETRETGRSGVSGGGDGGDGDVNNDGSSSSPPAGSKIACARLQIYRGSSEAYPAFVTPEAYAALRDYHSYWTASVGRAPRPRDPLFILAGGLPRRATISMTKKHVLGVVTRAGLRHTPADEDGRCARRHDVPLMNGFRRFWNKSCKESASDESALASLIKKEFMMGHAGLVKLDRNYFKAHVLELAAEYVLSVPALTIGDEERLLVENEKQARQIGRMRGDRDEEITSLRRTVDELARRMESMPHQVDGINSEGDASPEKPQKPE